MTSEVSLFCHIIYSKIGDSIVNTDASIAFTVNATAFLRTLIVKTGNDLHFFVP